MASSRGAHTLSGSLRTLAGAVEAARPGGPQATIRDVLRGRVAEAIVEEMRLFDRMHAQWRWLAANLDDARFADREETFLVTLNAYEDLCDAKAEAEAGGALG